MALKVTHFMRTGAVLLCCGTAVGCGTASGSKGSPPATPASRPETIAARVCQRAVQAARPLLGAGTRARIADADPASIECLVNARGVAVDAVAQAAAQAWMEYDTETVHQSQAYASGALHEPAQIPQPVPGLPGNVSWIPAQHEVVATNGTESRGGTYVTVTVTRRSSGGPPSLAVAAAVTRALLASAPRGPNPVPPN